MSSHEENTDDHSNEEWSNSLNYVMNIENMTINVNEGATLIFQSGNPTPNPSPPPPPTGG